MSCLRIQRLVAASAAAALLVGLLSVFHSGAVFAADKVTLQALFRDKAIVLVDGTRRVVKAGETTPEGVKLLATDTREETAELEFNGRREVLRLGVVAAAFASAARGSVTLYAEPSGHFHADGTINGVAVRFLVDTGATVVVMSGVAAQRVGIDYKRIGRPGVAQTASGVVRTFNFRLDKVQVGDITLHGVEASAKDGPFPSEILLGMSFLSRVDMKRSGERLEMEQRF
jgi:aspartyl protease family protein